MFPTNCKKIGRPAAQLIPRSWIETARDRAGVAALEFALIAPILLLILLGIIQIGLTFNSYLELTNGTEAGARQFASGRGSTTPWTTATSAVTSSAPYLTAKNVTITLQVNGAACASDAACSTALSNAAGQPATVSATYPCNLTIIGINFAPGCTLIATSTGLVE